MRVRISYIVEVPDSWRRQINEHYGRPGLADRAAIKAWYRLHGEAMDDDLSASWVGDDDPEEDDGE